MPIEECRSWADVRHALDSFEVAVALYFALRDRSTQDSSPEVWAIDLVAIDNMAPNTCSRAEDEHRREDLDPQFPISMALDPDPTRRDFFNRNGLVVSALPTVESQRLSSQLPRRMRSSSK